MILSCDLRLCDSPFHDQDELQALKTRVKEVVEENKLLHDEIKRSTVHEILEQGLEVEGVSPASWHVFDWERA